MATKPLFLRKPCSPSNNSDTSHPRSSSAWRNAPRLESSVHPDLATPYIPNTSLATPPPLSLVGSYENSLLLGRMSQCPSKPLPFLCQIGAIAHGNIKPHSLRSPPHIKLAFNAYFYDHYLTHPTSLGTPASPYVGNIDLEKHFINLMMEQEEQEANRNALFNHPHHPCFNSTRPFPGYQIPPKGQLQIMIKNTNHTIVKLFLVPYDLSDMSPGTKKVLRQKSYLVSSSPTHQQQQQHISSKLNSSYPKKSFEGDHEKQKPEPLKFAVQLQFYSPPSLSLPKQQTLSTSKGSSTTDHENDKEKGHVTSELSSEGPRTHSTGLGTNTTTTTNMDHDFEHHSNNDHHIHNHDDSARHHDSSNDILLLQHHHHISKTNDFRHDGILDANSEIQNNNHKTRSRMRQHHHHHPSQAKKAVAVVKESSSPATSSKKKPTSSFPKTRIDYYLHKSIRVIFNTTTLDSHEQLRTVIDPTDDQKIDQHHHHHQYYVSYPGLSGSPGSSSEAVAGVMRKHGYTTR